MKVSFLETGGFIGTQRGCDVDSALLEPGEAREVERLVGECGLASSETLLSGGARDRRQYEIVVERGGAPDGEEGRSDAPSESFRVVLDDATVPATARPLLAYLKRRAMPRGLG